MNRTIFYLVVGPDRVQVRFDVAVQLHLVALARHGRGDEVRVVQLPHELIAEKELPHWMGVDLSPASHNVIL